MIIDNILNLWPRKKSLNFEPYTCHDEIYTVWNAGFSLGNLLYASAEGEQNEGLMQHVANFALSYHVLKNSSKLLCTENATMQTLMAQSETMLNQQTPDFTQVNAYVQRIKQALIVEIKTSSTHLSNVFCFGFGLKELEAVFLYHHANVAVVTSEIDNLIATINSLDEGDKKLESTNLEISSINLSICRTSLTYLRHKSDEMALNSTTDNAAYKNFINKFFVTMLLDIILDIRNPSQLIKKKWIFITVNYVLVVAFLSVGEQIYSYLPQQNLMEFFRKHMSMDDELFQAFILITTLFVYALVFSFKKLNQYIIKILIQRKINQYLKIMLKQVKNHRKHTPQVQGAAS